MADPDPAQSKQAGALDVVSSSLVRCGVGGGGRLHAPSGVCPLRIGVGRGRCRRRCRRLRFGYPVVLVSDHDRHKRPGPGIGPAGRGTPRSWAGNGWRPGSVTGSPRMPATGLSLMWRRRRGCPGSGRPEACEAAASRHDPFTDPPPKVLSIDESPFPVSESHVAPSAP